jgi:hypothetical protein
MTAVAGHRSRLNGTPTRIGTCSTSSSHMSLRIDISIYNDKDMLAANHMPIAALPVPVAELVRMPVGVIPIGIGMYSGPIGSARMISTIGATNGRAAFSVCRRAIIGLNCRTSTVMGYFTIFPLISISIKSGGREGEED